MSAGTGVRHSEYNASQKEPVHFLQIWLLPERPGLEPGYEQKHYPESERRAQLRLIASRDGREGSVQVHQDAYVYAAILQAGESLQPSLASGRHTYLHVARGDLLLNGMDFHAGDAACISDESSLSLRAPQSAEFLMFDLA
jgi:redox-sensitive bicupin YhaK (pirin superfamily)